MTYNSYSPSHGLGREVFPKLGPHSTTVTVWTCHFTPDHTDSAWLVTTRVGSFPVTTHNITALFIVINIPNNSAGIIILELL